MTYELPEIEKYLYYLIPRQRLIKFIKESNAIEGIHRDPTEAEIKEFERFLALKWVSIQDLEKFVSVYAPGNVLREKVGQNVTIGRHHPPAGGAKIRRALEEILERIGTCSAHFTHTEYELLHAFTDGNGRSGRALWAWMMQEELRYFPELGFLHSFYYQTLDAARKA